MVKLTQAVLLMCIIVVLAVSAYPQTAPCRPGTMANVLGSSCSVGPVIFNFQIHFQAAVFDESTSSFRIITPTEIGFIPVQQGNQSGFKLVTNFLDNPPGSTHLVQFSYTPQSAPGFELRAQGLSMDAAAQGAPSNVADVQILDFQTYPNSGFLASDVAIVDENNVVSFDQLSNNVILEVPALLSTGSGFPNADTTQLSDLSSGIASSRLTSATFLYTTGPLVPVPDPAALTYTNIDLPGVAATFVSNITNSGRTVGSYQDEAGTFHGYIAEPDGSFTTVDVPGAPSTFAGGLNERGDVTGSYTDAAGQTHGFVRQDGQIRDIDVPQAVFTSPVAINNKGQIVGEYESADQGFHGFLLDEGVFTTIDHGPGTGIFASTQAFAINNSGEIGGSFFDPNTFRAFLQDRDSVEIVDVPGQGDTIIEGMNDRGDSVGSFNDINLTDHGFVRSSGIFRTVDVPDGQNTFPLGINASGKIVGLYTDSTGQQHSFIAEPGVGSTSNADRRQAAATSANIQSQQKPDCKNEQWQRRNAQLRNSGICQVKQ